jgi:hypothetical protein
LHTTTNADRGGTCQQVNVAPAEDNLHYAWDDAVVAAWKIDNDTPLLDFQSRLMVCEVV